MLDVVGCVVLVGDCRCRFSRVEDKAAVMGCEDPPGEEGKPGHGEGARPFGAFVSQAICLGVQRGEEGVRAGVVLGR